jgi:hypothetical protein
LGLSVTPDRGGAARRLPSTPAVSGATRARGRLDAGTASARTFPDRLQLDKRLPINEQTGRFGQRIYADMLIYIMGRGHSGSTILDIILGNSAQIESVGQLMTGLMDEQDGHVCACGETMQNCGYWQKVRQAFTRTVRKGSIEGWHEAGLALARHAHIRNLPKTFLSRTDSPIMQRLAQTSADVEQAIAVATNKPHIVDSSKEPTRGMLLLRFSPDAKVIYLVRDPRRLVASYYWRFKKRGGQFHFLRHDYYAPAMLLPFMLTAAVSWTVGNLICEIARRFAPERTLRVRYEDLCKAPSVEFGRIAKAFDLELDDVIAKVEHLEPLVIGHNVGGNQIRTEREVVFSPDKGKEHAMPRWLDYLTVLCCWPLMLFYGYFEKGGSTDQAYRH